MNHMQKQIYFLLFLIISVPVMAEQILLRPYKSSDTKEIIQLFYDTVHVVNAKDYTQEQLDAWAPKHIFLKPVEDSLSKNICYVAEIGGVIAGIADLRPSDGHLDKLFVHKDHQGKGIATMLFKKLEAHAQELGLSQITSDVSVTAKPFFEKMGFQVIKTQDLQTHTGLVLRNYLMKKQL